jgi:hypothetical protein
MEAVRNLEMVTSLGKEVEKDGDIVLYPNPGEKMIRIRSLDHNFLGVEIIDLQGRVQYRAERYPTDTMIPVDFLSDGIYLVRITTDMGSMTRKIRIE